MFRSCIFFAAMVAALGQVIYLSIVRPSSFARQALAGIYPQRLGTARPFDVVGAATLDHGNVFLHFVNFPMSPVGPQIELAYFRLAYELYPRRVFVTTTSDVINNNRRIVHVNALPGDAWLRAHDVHFIFTCDWNKGHPINSIEPVAQRPTTAEDR